jgi:hypothetical protein
MLLGLAALISHACMAENFLDKQLCIVMFDFSCLPAGLPACLPALLSTCLPACSPAHPHTCLPARLPACLSACSPACLIPGRC